MHQADLLEYYLKTIPGVCCHRADRHLPSDGAYVSHCRHRGCGRDPLERCRHHSNTCFVACRRLLRSHGTVYGASRRTATHPDGGIGLL